jgi:hypothetical protein
MPVAGACVALATPTIRFPAPDRIAVHAALSAIDTHLVPDEVVFGRAFGGPRRGAHGCGRRWQSDVVRTCSSEPGVRHACRNSGREGAPRWWVNQRPVWFDHGRRAGVGADDVVATMAGRESEGDRECDRTVHGRRPSSTGRRDDRIGIGGDLSLAWTGRLRSRRSRRHLECAHPIRPLRRPWRACAFREQQRTACGRIGAVRLAWLPSPTSGSDVRVRPPSPTSVSDLRVRPPSPTSESGLRVRRPSPTSDLRIRRPGPMSEVRRPNPNAFAQPTLTNPSESRVPRCSGSNDEAILSRAMRGPPLWTVSSMPAVAPRIATDHRRCLPREDDPTARRAGAARVAALTKRRCTWLRGRL